MGHLTKVYWTKPNKKTGGRTKKKSRKWYICFKKNGEWHREPAYTDKEMSEKMLARREREIAEEVELGPYVIALRKPISREVEGKDEKTRKADQGHAQDFRDDMRNRGLKITHWRTTYNRLLWILEKGEIKSLPELTPAAVNTALAALMVKGKSLGSKNGYLTAVKAFTAWLDDNDRIRRNPLGSLSKESTEGRETFVRRPLTEGEFSVLVQYAAIAPPFDDISGADRAALYVTAAYTGFRRLELSTVIPASFEFGTKPRLTVVAGKSKRKKREVIPLNASAAAYLERWLVETGKPPGKPVWPIGDIRTAEMIRSDLTSIGVQSFVPGLPGDPPTVIDFHSLRVVFVSRLAGAGVAPALTQKLARHSSVDLTHNIYAKLTADERIAAVATLPSLPPLAHALARGLAQNHVPGGPATPNTVPISNRKIRTGKKTLTTRKPRKNRRKP